MISTAQAPLAIAWALLVLGLAWRRRPSPVRIQRVRPPAAADVRTAPPVAPVSAAERRLGLAVVLGVAAASVSVVLAPLAMVVAWMIPGALASRHLHRRQAALAADLPDVVDLLALVAGAGLTVPLAVAEVARRGSGPLAAELARACDEVALGRRLADALDDLPSPSRGGESIRGLVAALVASERYGAALAPALDRLSLEVRADRRRRAEEAARKVPVKLLFPLVTCTLPAFALLTVAPLIASAIRSLRL